jgi:hypothetical protein
VAEHGDPAIDTASQNLFAAGKNRASLDVGSSAESLNGIRGDTKAEGRSLKDRLNYRFGFAACEAGAVLQGRVGR